MRFIEFWERCHCPDRAQLRSAGVPKRFLGSGGHLNPFRKSTGYYWWVKVAKYKKNYWSQKIFKWERCETHYNIWLYCIGKRLIPTVDRASDWYVGRPYTHIDRDI